MTSASGLVRSRQIIPLPPTFIAGVPNEVPTSTSGNRGPISTTSSQVGIVVARGLVGLHRLAELRARLVAALPVVLGAAERLAGRLAAGRAERRRGHSTSVAPFPPASTPRAASADQFIVRRPRSGGTTSMAIPHVAQLDML